MAKTDFVVAVVVVAAVAAAAGGLYAGRYPRTRVEEVGPGPGRDSSVGTPLGPQAGVASTPQSEPKTTRALISVKAAQ